MIEEYVPMDRCHDAFFERFMEQTIQKLNNIEQSGIEDSVPLPIEPLRTTTDTVSQKHISNISSVSGVNSPCSLNCNASSTW